MLLSQEVDKERYRCAAAKASTIGSFCEKKIIPPHRLRETVDDLRSLGRKIATLNGSFDLLHAGHLEILYEASQQADLLFVALNSDASIQQYKGVYRNNLKDQNSEVKPTQSKTDSSSCFGINRPIIPLEHRLRMMAALAFVDFVTWFEETDPRALLEKIRPDVHVNGAEYGEDCIEAEVVKRHGGRIHIVTLVPGLSTSHIIAKIQSLCD